MSWSIYITATKKITESDIDKVVSELPTKFKDKFNGAMKGTKQSWGWSLAVDLRLNSYRRILCSGSCGISGCIAEEFCDHFSKELAKHLDCKVKVWKMSV